MRSSKQTVEEENSVETLPTTPAVDGSEEALASGLPAEEDWGVKNDRRGFLIEKKYSEGLTLAEETELRVLQAEIARYLDEVAPISFEAVDALERIAKEIAGSSSDGLPASDPHAPR